MAICPRPMEHDQEQHVSSCQSTDYSVGEQSKEYSTGKQCRNTEYGVQSTEYRWLNGNLPLATSGHWEQVKPAAASTKPCLLQQAEAGFE